MARLKQAAGNYVVGQKFWNREAELRLFKQSIADGAHLLLVAQRRMGKTSLMREAARQLGDEYSCLFVDLQRSRDASEAVVELGLAMHEHKSLWHQAKDVFANVLNMALEQIDELKVAELGLTLGRGLTPDNWAEKGDRLFAILAESEKHVVLLLDEVPIMVNRLLKGYDFVITPERRAQTDHFMSWLRRISIRHKGEVSLVISGSIGLEPVLHQASLSATLTTFHPFQLDPWDEDTAISCIAALANEYGLTLHDGAAGKMIELLGCCIPHHVQMFFSRAYDHCVKSGKMELDAVGAEAVYQREMLGIRGHTELTHYEERLKLVLDKSVLPLCLEMLTDAAVTGCLSRQALQAFQDSYSLEDRSVKEAQAQILQVLEHDGYLEPTQDGFVFVSKLLSDWWERHYGLLHTPILERLD